MIEGEIPDEEMAFRLVKLYVEKISQRGEKRRMGLDTIINAYFYTLIRLRKKKQEMEIIEKAVEKEEEELGEGIEKVFFPEPKSGKEQFEFLE